MTTIDVISSETVTEWADQIRPHLEATVDQIVLAGKKLIEAKASLPHGHFGRLLGLLGLNAQTAQKFISIAQHPVISDATRGSHLPTAWTVLFELAKVPAEMLEEHLEAGTVGPSTTRREAVALRAPDDDRTAAKVFEKLFSGILPGLTGEDLMFVFEVNVSIKTAARRLVRTGTYSEPPACFNVVRYRDLMCPDLPLSQDTRPDRPSFRLKAFELMVEREAGDFLAWCEKAGVRFVGRKVILPDVWTFPPSEKLPGLADWTEDDWQMAAHGHFWCWWGIEEVAA